MISNSNQNQERLHRRRQVEAITGLSRSTIYAKMDPRGPHYDPTFPVPVRLGARAVAWRESEIVAWMNGLSRTEASR